MHRVKTGLLALGVLAFFATSTVVEAKRGWRSSSWSSSSSSSWSSSSSSSYKRSSSTSWFSSSSSSSSVKRPTKPNLAKPAKPKVAKPKSKRRQVKRRTRRKAIVRLVNVIRSWFFGRYDFTFYVIDCVNNEYIVEGSCKWRRDVDRLKQKLEDTCILTPSKTNFYRSCTYNVEVKF